MAAGDMKGAVIATNQALCGLCAHTMQIFAEVSLTLFSLNYAYVRYVEFGRHMALKPVWLA